MPTKYRYKNRPGYYVKGNVGGRMCTWQVRQGEGDQIPWDFDIQTLQWYIAQGILYTGRSGLGDESDMWVGSTVPAEPVLPSYRAVITGRVKVWTPSELAESRRLHDMGDSYRLGRDDYDENPALARYYYLGAAERGYAWSHLELARMCDGDSERISHYIRAGDLWDGYASLWGYIYAFEIYCEYGCVTEAEEVFQSAVLLTMSAKGRRLNSYLTFLEEFKLDSSWLGSRLTDGRLEVVRALAGAWADTFRDESPTRYGWPEWESLNKTSAILNKSSDQELRVFVETLESRVDIENLDSLVSSKIRGSEGVRFRSWASFMGIVGTEPIGAKGAPVNSDAPVASQSVESEPLGQASKTEDADLMWTVVVLICLVLVILLMLWVGENIASMDTSVRW